MGRMKGSPSRGEVNPLQRMLGTFLRLERAKLGYSTKDVADRLGLTDTYFRLAEAGRATLNQSLVFKIIEVFAASNVPTHDTGTISFNRFSVFLVGTHWVGAEMASQQSSSSAAKRAFEALASLVSDFQIFYEQTKGYFELEEGSGEQKRFLEDVAAPEVGSFLRSETYGRPRTVPDLLRVDDVPTLNIDIVLDLKRSLADRSFVHTDEIAARWESERASQFRYYRGLFTSPTLIVNDYNLSTFHYEYLLRERFNEGRFIFIKADENETEKTLRDRFVKLQNAGRNKVPDLNLKPMSREEINKLKFVCLDETERRSYNNDLGDLLRREGVNHKAYWSFENHSGLQIGFIGVRQGSGHGGNRDTESVRNLNLREADEKTEAFDRLWTNINAARSNKN